jgi:two-component system chemotaxis response regulator CheB
MGPAKLQQYLVSISINTAGVVRDVIVIGASSGGVTAVRSVLHALPADLPAFVGVVIHRSASPVSDWSQVFQATASLRVTEPVDGERLVRGCVYVAPADHHMKFSDDCVGLDRGPKHGHSRPSVDALFVSAAAAYGRRVVAIVLTGNGGDGAQGCLAVSARGGICIVQRPRETVVPSMPVHAIAVDHIQGELSIEDMAPALFAMAHGGGAQVQPVGRNDQSG